MQRGHREVGGGWGALLLLHSCHDQQLSSLPPPTPVGWSPTSATRATGGSCRGLAGLELPFLGERIAKPGGVSGMRLSRGGGPILDSRKLSRLDLSCE